MLCVPLDLPEFQRALLGRLSGEGGELGGLRVGGGQPNVFVLEYRYQLDKWPDRHAFVFE